MERFSRATRAAGSLLIPAIGAAVLGQYALDANLQVGGGRVNPEGGYSMPLQPDIYRINRNTGTFQYDERAAFWSPRRYTTGMQESLMRTGVMDTYSRPVVRSGPEAGVYTLDRRSGTFRYNEANAFAPRAYNVYQSAAPAPMPEKPIEIGQSTPRYREAPRGGSSGARSVTINATIPASREPYAEAGEAAATAGATGAPASAGSITNLTPQVYRPPFVHLAQGTEGG